MMRHVARSRPSTTQPVPALTDLPADAIVKKLTSAGIFMLNRIHYEILIEHTQPEPGLTYVGDRRPTGRPPRNH